MNTLEINVGLLVGQSSVPVPVLEALAHVQRRLGKVQTHRVAPSATEPTLIAIIESPLSVSQAIAAVEALCDDLSQQAIAFKFEGAGFLVGPQAEAWGGEFLENEFIPY